MADPLDIQKLFAAIAHRYAIVNHLLSGGFDFWWRHYVAKKVTAWRPQHLLDVATGSGDLAMAIAKKNPTTTIIGIDFCAEMLAQAKKKNQAIMFLEADGMALPFEQEKFDVVTVAFGLRNMPPFEKALHEMRRVLQSGGHLLILDFSIPTSPFLKSLYRFYLHYLLPHLAGWLTGKSDAYEYMGASIETFPAGEAMKNLLEKCGFANPTATPLTWGIVTVYTATKVP